MKNSALRWLWTVPGKLKLYILVLTVVQMLHGVSGVLYALLLRQIVDAAVGQDRAGFWRGMLGVILLVATQLAMRAVIRWLSELSRASLENRFKARLTDAILHRDYLRVSAVHSGEWMNRLTNDTVVAANACVEILPGLAGMGIKLLSALVMIVALEPRFAAVFLPAGLLTVLLTWLFRRVLKKLHKEVQASDGRLRIFLQERIGSLLVIRSYAADRPRRRQRQKWSATRLRGCGKTASPICATSASARPSTACTSWEWAGAATVYSPAPSPSAP